MKTEIVPPDATRMIEGLRDTGYDFNTAIADLIDNSIAASATSVVIELEMDYTGEIDLSVADNGSGMTMDELLQGMKYGSPPRPDPRSLGKFGLGMKTASSSFARVLAVTTRSSTGGSLSKAVWDLDHVASVSDWELILEDPTEDELGRLDKVADGQSGTVVRWAKVDRLLKDYQDPGGAHARKALQKKVDGLREHLSLVYHRFLDPEDERELHKIAIWLGNEQVEAWDPFVVTESELVAEETVPVSPEDSAKVLGEFKIRAYVLPRKEEFPDQETFRNARLRNKNQGIYIYRENRLIHGPDWLGMFIKEPHLTLLRIEFSFGAELDETLQIDIKKSRIALNETIHRWLKEEFLGPPRRAAGDRYRRGRRRQETEIARTGHETSNVGIGANEKGVRQATIESVDAETGEVDLQNTRGRLRVHLPVSISLRPGEVFVQPVQSIDDGLLWTPTLIDGHQGIQLNQGHEFYRKLYLPNIYSADGSSINVQGMDYLMWALGIAELNTVQEEVKDHFSDLRYEVSRTVRKLVDELPDPPEPEEIGG